MFTVEKVEHGKIEQKLITVLDLNSLGLGL